MDFFYQQHGLLLGGVKSKPFIGDAPTSIQLNLLPIISYHLFEVLVVIQGICGSNIFPSL